MQSDLCGQPLCAMHVLCRWWRSFLSGGSAGLFIYVYCLYYYVNHSEMSGILQVRPLHCSCL